MSEQAFWVKLRDKLQPYGKFTRVENSCEKGTPDVNYVLLGGRAGWFELKYEPTMPGKGEEFTLSTLTKEQLLWQEDYWGKGGVVYTIARVGGHIVTLTPPALRKVYEKQAGGWLAPPGIDIQELNPFPLSWLLHMLRFRPVT